MAISSDEQRRLVFTEALSRAPNFKEETNAARPTTAEHEHAFFMIRGADIPARKRRT